MDYNSVQLNTSSLTGIESYSFASGNTADERMDANTIATQMGTAVLACGNDKPQTVAGVAFKMTSCAVTAAGDAQVTFQVCSAPSRGNPIVPPEKVMKCSDDPSASNFYPKPGYSCEKPTCSTEPLDSLNGWSSPKTISYEQSVAVSGSEDDKSKNGLGMVFYPSLTGGTPSFSADSDSMTAVKVVQTAINSETRTGAVGLRIAFRHKVKVTKDMMVEGTSSVPDPKKNSAAWETIEKLQGNALIPQYQATYAANGSECLQQIQNGLSTDGVVSVCDQQYTNEAGIKPIALTAQVGAEGQNCGTTAQCLTEVVNTNTWTQTCSADVPLSIRKCTTQQDYEMETLSYVRTRSTEQCIEERTSVVKSCETSATIGAVKTSWAPASDLTFSGSTSAQTVLKFDRAFSTPMAAQVIEAKIGVLHVDNWGEIRLNGVRIYAKLNNNLNQVKDANTYANCGNETWMETYMDGDGNAYEYLVSGVKCTMQDGSRVVANYNDDCDATCKGPVRVDISIPMNLVRLGGHNVIEMSCFNNQGPSACNFTVELKYLNISKYEVINGCTELEASR